MLGKSSAELRASLKEAVPLKPLQDAVKREGEGCSAKTRIYEQGQPCLEELQRELKPPAERCTPRMTIEHLQDDMETLISAVQSKSAGCLNAIALTVARNACSVESTGRTQGQAKRRKNAQNSCSKMPRRFNTLHQQNAEVEAMNNELQSRLHQAEDSLNPAFRSDEPEYMQTK
jgi:hypothetical protein